MTNPIVYQSKSARFGLPFLFSGQAQKEFFVNEAHALVDALLHPVVEGAAATPPAVPAEGDCWLVSVDPSGAWIGHEGQIACFQAGSWLFAVPSQGMRVFDRSVGSEIRHLNGWKTPSAVSPPAGGASEDAEARAAISALIEALADLGLIRQGP